MNKNQIIALVAFIAFALLLLAFIPPPASLTEGQTGKSVLLGTFEGVTPCADCPGIQTRLTLIQDAPYSAEGIYELSLTYLERDVEPFVTTGIWTTERGTPTDPDATVYVLNPDMPEKTQRYLRVDDETIRQLDQEGNEIDSSLPFDLSLTVEGSPATMPETRTLAGASTCLAHKDPNLGTEECALGFKADGGMSYVLDLGLLESTEASTLIQSGARVEVTGTFTPVEALSNDHWMKYEMEGVIRVTSVRAL